MVQNYLLNRKQFVKFNNVCSQSQILSTGLPQGSVLGPLLFLLFINDLHFVSDKLNFVLFADDTNILFSGKIVQNLNEVLNQELSKVCKWFTANKLVVNMKKTNYIVFRRRKVGGDFNELNVKFDNVLLTRVNSTKFLGVYIDEYLTWKSHVSYISSKIASVLGIIYSVNKLLPQKILMNLYNTLILPHFSYAVLAWGGCLITLTNRLQILQKKVVRAITNSNILHILHPCINA